MSDNNKKQLDLFLEKVKALREEFPQCYIETWTPLDFTYTENDVEDDTVSMEWDDPRAVEVAEQLYRVFDANHGTNWDVITEVIYDVIAANNWTTHLQNKNNE